MKPLRISILRKGQEGAVAVEAALCLVFILIPLFSITLLTGKFFWYYTVAQKSTHDAALYLAGAPFSEIKSGSAGALAMEIMSNETSDFDDDTNVIRSVICEYKFGNTNATYWSMCNSNSTPFSVQAVVELNITHPFFLPLSGTVASGDTIILVAYSKIAYVGI